VEKWHGFLHNCFVCAFYGCVFFGSVLFLMAEKYDLYIIWIEGKMNDIGGEVNGTELENVQNVDVHYSKYNVNASILDGNNVLISDLYKEFFVVFMLLSCC